MFRGLLARSALYVLLAPAILAGCDPAPPVQPSPEFSKPENAHRLLLGYPKEAEDHIFNVLGARWFYNNCRKQLDLNVLRIQKRETDLNFKYQPNIKLNFPDYAEDASGVNGAELERRIDALTKKRGIVRGDKVSICAAGIAEARDKTEMGKFLIVR